MVLNRQRHFLKIKRKENLYIIYINKNLSTTGIGLSELKSEVFFLWDYYYFWKIVDRIIMILD